MNALFSGHAVRRILLRKIPVHIVERIASYGVPVRDTKDAVLIRGMWGDKAVHVLRCKHTHAIRTVYVAEEWDSHIAVKRSSRRTPRVSIGEREGTP